MKKVTISRGMLVAALIVIAMVALTLSKLFGINFWVVLIAVTAVVYINGLLNQRRADRLRENNTEGPLKLNFPPDRTDK